MQPTEGPLNARFPGTCARTGKDYPPGTPITRYGKKWQIAPGHEDSVPADYKKPPRPEEEEKTCWECGCRFTYRQCKSAGGDWSESYCGC